MLTEKRRMMRLQPPMPALRPGQDKITYAVSVGQEAHQGTALRGTLNVIAQHAALHGVEPRILVSCTAQRFSYRIGNDITEEQALTDTYENGHRWRMKHMKEFTAVGISEQNQTPLDYAHMVFLRWEDFRNSRDAGMRREFAQTCDAFRLLLAIDPYFKADAEETKRVFLSRGNRPNLDPVQLQKAEHLIEEFLIEEAAVYTMLARMHPGVLVYPGPPLQAFERPRNNQFDIPADLPLAALPESLRGDLQECETPAGRLLRAATGMHLQTFIELQKRGIGGAVSYPPYSITTLQESMGGLYSTLNERDRVIAEYLQQIPDQRALRLLTREAVEASLEPVAEDMLDTLRRADANPTQPERPADERHGNDKPNPTSAPKT